MLLKRSLNKIYKNLYKNMYKKHNATSMFRSTLLSIAAPASAIAAVLLTLSACSESETELRNDSADTAAINQDIENSEVVENADTLADMTSAEVKACLDYGPQTPRDIDAIDGSNAVNFRKAASYDKLNLCNIHFHKSAEHKAAAFSIYAGKEGDNGQAGYQCGISKTLTKAELAPVSTEVCDGLQPGDTVEVHWVHSSCPVQPGEGLGSCLSEGCDDPDLRVETQVFTLVNDSNAMNFMDMDYDQAGFQNANDTNARHQAKMIPDTTGKPVEFLGSTTGPSYNESKCSPLKVNWSVRPECAKLDINSLGKWCEGNTFNEMHAHGVRALVTNPSLLSRIER